MGLDYGLYTQLKTKQILTPQQIQFLEVLQLPLPELISMINDYLTENPFLEQKDNNDTDRDIDSAADSLSSDNDRIVSGLLENDRISAQESYGSKQYDNNDEDQNQKEIGSCLNYESLQDYLNMQLRLMYRARNITEQEYNIAEYLIGNIDDNGYLSGTVEEHSLALKRPTDSICKALEIIQSMDPCGVGARDLEECLGLQLKLLPDCPPEMPQIIKYLHSLASGHLQKISSALNIPVERIRKYAEILKLLNPKPGAAITSDGHTKYILPDGYIIDNGSDFEVIINEWEIPHLYINNEYKNMLLDKDSDQKVKEYVKERVISASNLIKNVEQRRNTLQNVIKAITEKQKDFLKQGIQGLKPLTLGEIASQLGVHESTVSRAVSGKYVQTPQGLVTLKSLFSGSINAKQDITPRLVKEKIKEIIKEEDCMRPKSDQNIAEVLNRKGIDISRRTVAKYREELGIPSKIVRTSKK